MQHQLARDIKSKKNENGTEVINKVSNELYFLNNSQSQTLNTTSGLNQTKMYFYLGASSNLDTKFKGKINFTLSGSQQNCYAMDEIQIQISDAVEECGKISNLQVVPDRGAVKIHFESTQSGIIYWKIGQNQTEILGTTFKEIVQKTFSSNTSETEVTQFEKRIWGYTIFYSENTTFNYHLINKLESKQTYFIISYHENQLSQVSENKTVS
eukprot:TRINITY_DN2309_c0_g2_i3.p4 TRINITY_DN2309_c0_g2~~TRINITY_DN2309_c0_g2_i3.p4  ORF type:complete len:211 (-),score=25.15 TRINITY_DN2309_c0_g2_i3:946-1578(-)